MAKLVDALDLKFNSLECRFKSYNRQSPVYIYIFKLMNIFNNFTTELASGSTLMHIFDPLEQFAVVPLL